VTGIFGNCSDWVGEMRFESGRMGVEATPGWWVAGELKHESDRTALDAAGWTPRAIG